MRAVGGGRGRGWRRVGVAAACLAAPALVAGLIWRFGTNVPFWDDWFTGGLLLKAKAGALGAGDLFAQHNEHRPVTARVVHLLVAGATGWGRWAGVWTAGLWATLAVAGATGVLLHRVARRTVGPRWAWAATAVAGVFLFSTVQFFNWLWAFEVQLYLQGLCMAAGLWAATARRWPSRARAWGAAGAAVLGTYTAAGGFFLWALLGAVLWAAEGVRRRDVAWAWGVLGVLAVGGYRWGYRHPSEMPVADTSPAALAARWSYLPKFLGVPVSWGLAPEVEWAALLGGLVLLALLGAGVGYLVWRGDRGLWGRAYPWLAVSGYAVAVGAGAWMARPTEPMAMRYVTMSAWLSVGLVYLWAVVARDLAGRNGGPAAVAVRRASVVAAGVVVAHGAVSAWRAWEQAGVMAADRRQAMGALQWSAVVEAGDVRGRLCPFRFTDGGPDFVERGRAMDEAGLLWPRMRRSRVVEGARVAGGHGRVERVEVRGKVGVAAGWAVLPERGGPADDVVVTAELADGSSVAVAVADRMTGRADVARAVGDGAYTYCGWLAVFDAGGLPAGTRGIAAWAWDARAGRAYRLEGGGPVGRGGLGADDLR